MGETGIYTIVAEEYDAAGNLWGKLKSGVGWVLLDIVNISHEPEDNGGNPIYGGNTSGGGNTTQQPALCSHNYTDATCTTPKTCTLCGQTSGSELGHTYSVASCTVPQTCNRCGATNGSAAGHKWTDITQTVYYEAQGHYEEVPVLKTSKKIKCFACSNKSNSLE